MIWTKKRFQVLKRDKFRCQYCGKTGKDVTLEVDHIVPQAKWWTDDLDNLITCCRECNSWKSDELLWTPINIGKIRLYENEGKTIKWFFDSWNKMGYWEISKENIAFISWFVKLFYADFSTKYLPMEVKKWVITQSEFEEWGEKCVSICKDFDDLIRDDVRYILDNLESNNPDYDGGWTRYTDDYNERLNWLITYQMVRFGYPRPFIYKYSLCPNKVDEWQNERDERFETH